MEQSVEVPSTAATATAVSTPEAAGVTTAVEMASMVRDPDPLGLGRAPWWRRPVP